MVLGALQFWGPHVASCPCRDFKDNWWTVIILAGRTSLFLPVLYVGMFMFYFIWYCWFFVCLFVCFLENHCNFCSLRAGQLGNVGREFLLRNLQPAGNKSQWITATVSIFQRGNSEACLHDPWRVSGMMRSLPTVEKAEQYKDHLFLAFSISFPLLSPWHSEISSQIKHLCSNLNIRHLFKMKNHKKIVNISNCSCGWVRIAKIFYIQGLLGKSPTIANIMRLVCVTSM